MSGSKENKEVVSRKSNRLPFTAPGLGEVEKKNKKKQAHFLVKPVSLATFQSADSPCSAAAAESRHVTTRPKSADQQRREIPPLGCS